jgi:hypothetical protein
MFGFPSSVGGAPSVSRVDVQPQEEVGDEWDSILDAALGEMEAEERANPTVPMNPISLSEILEQALREQERELGSGGFAVSDYLPPAPTSSFTPEEQMEKFTYQLFWAGVEMYQKDPEDIRKSTIFAAKFIAKGHNFAPSNLCEEQEFLTLVGIQSEEQKKMIDHLYFDAEVHLSVLSALDKNPEVISGLKSLPPRDFMNAVAAHNSRASILKVVEQQLPIHFEKYKEDMAAYLRKYLLEVPVDESLQVCSEVDEAQLEASLFGKGISEEDVLGQLQGLLGGCSLTSIESESNSFRKEIFKVIELYQQDKGSSLLLFTEKGEIERLLYGLDLASEEVVAVKAIEGFEAEVLISFYHALTINEERLTLSKEMLNRMTCSWNWMSDFLIQLQKDNYESYIAFSADRSKHLRTFMAQAQA